MCRYRSISSRMSFTVLTIDKFSTLRSWKYKYLSKICAFYSLYSAHPALMPIYHFHFFLFIFLPIPPIQHSAYSDFISINIAENACFIDVFLNFCPFRLMG